MNMMNGKFRVTANRGFKSCKKGYIEAIIFAFKLEHMGNVNVKVVPA